MKKVFLIICTCSLFLRLTAQEEFDIALLHDSLNTSLRGLSVVDDTVIWVSGSKGYVGKSVNGGFTWDFKQMPLYPSAEFRDIEAIDATTAVVMSSVEPACILKTTDGGMTWKEMFRDNDAAVFLDGFDFYDADHGVCIGDPIAGRFYILKTDDGGNTWTKVNNQTIVADSVAAFAASGTSIEYFSDGRIYFATGGKLSVIYASVDGGRTWKLNFTPIVSGKPSQGIFSMAFTDPDNGCIIGGDYEVPESRDRNFALCSGGPGRMMTFDSAPGGYRSCAAYLNTLLIIACGSNGVDVFNTENFAWTPVSSTGFNVVQKAKKGTAVYFAGNNGRVGKLLVK